MKTCTKLTSGNMLMATKIELNGYRQSKRMRFCYKRDKYGVQASRGSPLRKFTEAMLTEVLRIY